MTPLLQNPQQAAFLTRDVRGTSCELPGGSSCDAALTFQADTRVSAAPLLTHRPPLGSRMALANLSPGRLNPQELCHF